MKKCIAFALSILTLIGMTACSSQEAPKDTTGSAETAGAATQAEAVSTSEAASSGSYTPQKNITIFAPYSAGGGVDSWGRNVSGMLSSTGLSDSNWVYENVNGGTGQVGLGTVVSQYTGNDAVLIPTATNYLITPYIQGKEYSYKDLTMVAQLVVDYRVFVTSSQSGYKTMEDLVKAGQEKELVGALSGVGGIGHIALEMLKSASSIQLRAVPFDGSEDVVALLGNQVDVGCLSLSEALPYVESGDMVILAVTAPERLEAIADIPTCKELGYDIELKTGRGFAMPGDVSAEARDYWAEKLKALLETDEFKAYLETSQNTVAYLAGDEYVADLEKDYDTMKEIMVQLGLAE
ncbi:Bug family tripartite tricarboxylate transporter substrate binding protein [Hominifimenecus sp. rT4P-3]|uniref:Bug family tripartite tricarboxylate transporter substrate binding protein n=1 Tax=Hominifimenecus sp. rT4P-3 TaxID=3242979 RepID=UPI003DA5C8BC